MQYGLECEFFVRRGSDIIGALDASLTPDECGFLAEARGKPQWSILEAVFSLKADIHRLNVAATKLGLTLVCEPLVNVPRNEILKSRRVFSKGRLEYQNLYGYKEHKNRGKKTGGIHISFTNPRETYVDGELVGTYNHIFDFVQIFRKLDLAFKDEIKSAGRYPGFYELKPDGRIEYRSLPNNVDLLKVVEVLS